MRRPEKERLAHNLKVLGIFIAGFKFKKKKKASS